MRWIFILLVSILPGRAAVYYISPIGNDTTGDGSIDNPWLSFSKLNGLSAGDVGYLRGGTYYATNNFQYFEPTNSGTAINPIIVSNYPSETPIITGSTNNQMILEFNDVSYIKVFGLTITNCARPVQWSRTTNCELGYCTVTDRGSVPFGTGDNYLVRIWDGSNTNWIHHCVISKGMIGNTNTPVSGEGSDSGTTFALVLGYYQDTNISTANRIENSIVYHGGHDIFLLSGNYNIIRSNYFHNEGWYRRANYTNLIAGNRALASDGRNGGFNIIEWNRFGPTGWVLDNGSAGYTVVDHSNIIRHNTFAGCCNYGIQFYTKDYGAYGISYASSNYFYNNTLAYNGWVPNTITNTTTEATQDNTAYSAHVFFNDATNNVLVNNVFWRGWGNEWFKVTTNSILTSAGDNAGNYWSNNYSNSAIDLNFTDAGSVWDDAYNYDVTVSQTSPNWSINASSTLIDAGAFLTTITSDSGSGTSFTVADPMYFFDGYNVVDGDLIQLQGQATQVRITDINYTTSTITVSSPLTWANGQGVALAYTGNAPDIGAYEYQTPVTTLPRVRFRWVTN